MVGRIIATCIRFRLLVVVAAAGLIVFGVSRVPSMHSDVLPETSPTAVEVQTEALGLSGPEVESLITVPMETGLLDGIMGVTRVTSDSVPGLSSIQLHFQPGFDMFKARQLVQERLNSTFALPNVSKPPVMLQPVSSSSRVMMIGLTSTKLSPIELSVLARWTIVPRLLGLAGVANVSTFGQADRQLQVQVDPARLAANHVTLQQIIQTAGNSQLVSPLTYLEGSTPGTGGFLEGPNQRLTIRHVLPFGTPKDLGQVPVQGVNGPPLQLGQVASVVEDHQPLIGNALVNGRPGLVLVVQKLPSASVPAVTHEIDGALGELRPGLQGVNIDSSLFRASSYVRSSHRHLLTGLVIAAVLTALALVALLFSLRSVLIAAATVALSMLTATLVLDLLGYTFNILAAVGLLIALGVVVDEAVADTRRHRRSAPTYASLAVLLLIAPAFLASGVTARFVHPMLLAMALAVLASMAVALTVAPALGALLPAKAGHLHPFTPHARAWLDSFVRTYRWLLEHALRLPKAALVGVCAVGLAAVLALPLLGAPKPPTFIDRSLIVSWSGAPGTSLSEMNRITARASGEIRALPQVQSVGATMGRAVTSDQIVNSNSGQLWVTLKPGADYDVAVGRVRSIVQTTPGMQASVATPESASMPGVLAPADHRVVARVYGQDFGQLAQLGEQIRRAMSKLPGLRHAEVQVPPQQPTLSVQVDLAKAEQAGVKPGDVRREASTLISGLTVGNFFEQQKVFDVVVVGTPAVRSSVSSAQNLELDSVDGGHVKLGDIASVGVGPAPTAIQREAISRYVDVTATVSTGNTASAQAAVAKVLKQIKYPLEYRAEVQRDAVDPATPHDRFLTYALAAMIGIILLAQAALGSWSLSLVLFLLTPVSLAGGLLAALLAGTAGTLGAAAGLLAVAAISLRQSFGMAGELRRLRDPEHQGLTERAVLEGSLERATPIITAAVVLAVALLPFALIGDDLAGGELVSAAAIVALGGLISSTLLNLFVLPAVVLRLTPTTPEPVSEEMDELDWETKPMEVAV